jgi:hypothetical protein
MDIGGNANKLFIHLALSNNSVKDKQDKLPLLKRDTLS